MVAYIDFRPLPGRLGAFPNLLTGLCTTTIANSGTTNYNFGGHPARCYLNRAMVSAGTAAADLRVNVELLVLS